MSGAMFGKWLGVATLVGGLALAPCAPVQARSKKPVLVYGPGMAGDEAESAARDDAAVYLRGSRRSAPAYHLSEVPFFGPAPLWAVGDVEVRPCSAAARDTAEIRAINRVFGERATPLRVASIKGHVGHTAGAAGVMGLMAGLHSMKEEALVPTAGTTEVDPEAEFEVVIGQPAPGPIAAIQVNGFGFGGQNASLVVTRD